MTSSPSAPPGIVYHDESFLSTLDHALNWFRATSNSNACLMRRRWPDGIVRCPTCGRDDVRYLASRELWECRTRHARSQFSIRVGTIFEDSHIPLGLWLATVWMLANTGKPSSHELARRLGITQKSAWSMLRRITCALQKAALAESMGETGAEIRN